MKVGSGSQAQQLGKLVQKFEKVLLKVVKQNFANCETGHKSVEGRIQLSTWTEIKLLCFLAAI